jgi:hypothetical protein
MLCKCCRKPLRYLKNKFVFNSLLRFLIETYYPVAIVTFLSISSLKAATAAEKANTLLTTFFAIYLAGLPYLIYRFLRLYKPLLALNDIKHQYHALYLQIDHYRVEALSLAMLLLYRKLMITVFVVMLQTQVTFQLIMCLYVQFIFLMYTVAARPMFDRWSGAVFLLNEIVIYCVTLMTFLFTDFVYIDTEKYKFGDVVIYMICVMIGIDVLNLAVSGIYFTKLFLEAWIDYRNKKAVL